MTDKRLALVMTYAHPDAENRLKTQLVELKGLGFEIHTVGLGKDCLTGVAKHFELPAHSGILGFSKVALIHLTKNPQSRFMLLRFPKTVINELNSFNYELVITHDLELLPALTNPNFGITAFHSSIRHVDLHELHEFKSPTSGVLGVVWWLLRFRLRSYHDWLISQLKSNQIDLVTVVNEAIGNWYLANGYLTKFEEIRNAAPYLDIKFESRSSKGIKFLYHGKFAKTRGLDNLVEASLYLKPEDSIHFMLTGDPRGVQVFQSFAKSKNPRINFHPPVPMNQVSREISKFDVEIIYFEPATQNLLFTLPNKFFEAVQGRLAVISGPSPELVRHIDQLANGLYLEEWGAKRLSKTLRSIDRLRVEEMRLKSHEAAAFLNSKSEGEKLRRIWRGLIRV